ncbi:MAG: M48 family metallopeptidase [Cyanobacteria bacterium P01_D01_bin.71]
MNQLMQGLRQLGKRWMYGAMALVVAAGLVVATPQPSKADLNLFELIFNGIQYIQLSNLNDDQEVDLGRQTDQALRRQGVRIYNRDPELVNYVNAVGQRLAAVSDRNQIPYTFQVVDDNSINAFATSGGFVYINTGLLRAASTEAELAGVMSHEIGHIARRHSVNRMREITLANGIVGALGVSQDDLVNIGVQLALFLPNSRTAEYEADDQGYVTMGRAGYDQRGLISFMQKLEGSGTPEFFSTHPDPGNRVNRLQEMYASSRNETAVAGNNPEAYRSMISNL